MVTETEIRARLNTIVDPCSAAAGVPAGLQDMGLIRSVNCVPSPKGAVVEVVIAVTEYGCLLGGAFAQSAYEALAHLPGLAAVEVKLDDRFDWLPQDMTLKYQEKLEAHRKTRRQGVEAIRFHPRRTDPQAPSIGDSQ